MKKNPTFVWVVAARIVDPRGRLLLQQGLPGKAHAGLWEFPGGKVDPGEHPREALVREVFEELGIALAPDTLEPAGFAEEAAAPGRPALVLILYTCREWTGEPQAREGQEWAWFAPEDACRLPLAKMDRALFERSPSAWGE